MAVLAQRNYPQRMGVVRVVVLLSFLLAISTVAGPHWGKATSFNSKLDLLPRFAFFLVALVAVLRNVLHLVLIGSSPIDIKDPLGFPVLGLLSVLPSTFSRTEHTY